METRYLRKIGTSEIFPYTLFLALRKDMELLDELPKQQDESRLAETETPEVPVILENLLRELNPVTPSSINDLKSISIPIPKKKRIRGKWAED